VTEELAGYQRRALRAQAHSLQALCQLGKEGVSESLCRSVDEALAAHELIKVRFVDHKESRKALAAELAEKVGAALAGVVGHVAILYRPHADVAKRRIQVPQREGDA
jgi:RNA-binding protein